MNMSEELDNSEDYPFLAALPLRELEASFPREVELEAMRAFVGIVRRLRSPSGCPWDRKQTLASMRRYVIEESYELLEGIDEERDPLIREELGDVLLIVVMMAVIAEQEGRFAVSEVFREISEKLVRRHPHVFGGAIADDPDSVKAQWEEIKKQEKAGANGKDGAAGNGAQGASGGWDAGVARSVPPLERAKLVQKAAAKEGFDWPKDWGLAPLLGKVSEELQEFRAHLEENPDEGPTAAGAAGSQLYAPGPGENGYAELEDEIGDLLFAVVNLARKAKIDPSIALTRATDKFSRRYGAVAQEIAQRELETPDIETLEAIWQELKTRE